MKNRIRLWQKNTTLVRPRSRRLIGRALRLNFGLGGTLSRQHEQCVKGCRINQEVRRWPGTPFPFCSGEVENGKGTGTGPCDLRDHAVQRRQGLSFASALPHRFFTRTSKSTPMFDPVRSSPGETRPVRRNGPALGQRLRAALELVVHYPSDRRSALLQQLTHWLGEDLDHEANADQRFELLTQVGRNLLPKYRFTWPSLAWWDDAAFNTYLRRFGEDGGFNIQRRWEVYQLLRLTAGVPGDTAECGVYQGAGSYLMAAANRLLNGRVHHGFDSFAGLSEPSARDGQYWTAGNLSSPLQVARSNLAEFGEAVHLYPGWIPQRFTEVAERRFRFVHIDVDLYEPTRDSLTFFYPHIELGGIIVCDDYLFSTCPGATAAVDEYLADKPEKMLALAAGGGFLIKGTTTGASALAQDS
jgi:O-methyltransferase